ncbi:MAG: hypothetical protein IJO06_15120 [Thermoguttaceae bacterium]|nr:hypothetical protein [Thermoguttaceae bacterium]
MKLNVAASTQEAENGDVAFGGGMSADQVVPLFAPDKIRDGEILIAEGEREGDAEKVNRGKNG